MTMTMIVPWIPMLWNFQVLDNGVGGPRKRNARKTTETSLESSRKTRRIRVNLGQFFVVSRKLSRSRWAWFRIALCLLSIVPG